MTDKKKLEFAAKKLGSDLEKFRVLKMNHTLKQAADIIGISYQGVKHIEAGVNVRMTTFVSVINYMRADPKDYFTNNTADN